MTFILGMSTRLPFDTLYTISTTQMERMDFTLNGYSKSFIAAQKNASTWEMKMPSDANDYAIMNGTVPPFGTHEYLLSENLGGGQIALHINACNDRQEFNCKDGSCIPIEERCDSVFDCVDRSDEDGCHMIEVPSSYLRHVPDQDQTKVVLTLDVVSLLDISEVTEIFRVKYQLNMIWQDKRLRYLNLKKDSFLNIVAHVEAVTIWTPTIVFKNTQNMDESQVKGKSSFDV